MSPSIRPALNLKSFALISTDRLNTVLVHRKERSSYAPFGHASGITAQSGFTGAPYEPSALGYLLGNGYRFYAPGILRFGSPDALSPFGLGGINCYGYCSAEPINHHDRSGHLPQILKNFISFVLEVKDVAKHSLVPGQAIFDATRVPRRIKLDEIVSAKPQSHFTRAVQTVNLTQMSNGTRDLPPKKFVEYSTLAMATNRGDIGITRAFAISALGWLRGGSSRPAENVVGGIFNFGGAFVSGSIEHTYYKTGRVLKQVPGL